MSQTNNRDMLELNKKYRVLVNVEDEEELSLVISSIDLIGTIDVVGISGLEDMISILKNDHTFDILVISYDEFEVVNVIKQIRRYNTSIYIILLVNDIDEAPAIELLSRYNIQGFCPKVEGYEELKLWIYSGTRVLEQTKMLKQLYVQTKKQAETIKELNLKLTTNYYETIDTLRRAVDKKDPYTRGHSDRVGYISALIARELKLSEDEIERIRLGGSFHDIGKIGIKDSILTKPGKLTEEEYEEIKKHPVIGYELLEKNNIFKDVLMAIRNHHERYDGKGYPDGLRGDEIPLIAKIVALADSFDAMMSKRSYREKLELEYTVNEIKKNKGIQFDPVVAEAFIRLIEDRYAEIINLTGKY